LNEHAPIAKIPVLAAEDDLVKLVAFQQFFHQLSLKAVTLPPRVSKAVSHPTTLPRKPTA
jgi:hypothetical protein